MAGSTYGTIFSITTWGESHGAGVGVVIDGCPAGLSLCEEDIQIYLDRRRPGQNSFTTARKEADQAIILSGVFNGQTTGTPISIMINNTDHRSHDYSKIKDIYRPGHADYTFDSKYGFRDYRGGGRSSGRETIGRVAAGAVAAKILRQLGISVSAYTKSIGNICIPESEYEFAAICNNPLYMPNDKYAKKAACYLEECKNNNDSTGGIIECIVNGLPAGIGEPVFEKLDANLSKAILSIGSVKGVEFGDGFHVSKMTGSENNDSFQINKTTREIEKKTNHSGGILGGISDGGQVIFRAAFKPTPSISQPQHTVSVNKEETTITVTGRHDPVIVPRAVVVVEAMTAVTVLDMLLINMTSRMDYLTKIYSK